MTEKRSGQPIEIPEPAEGWMRLVMGDVSDVVGGGTPSTSDPANFSPRGSGVAWITPADLSGFHESYIERGSRDLSQKGLRESSARVLPAETVLMSSRAPIGYVAIARKEIATNQGFKSFICQEGIVPEYIFHWLRFIEPLLQHLGSGSTFAEISGSRAKEIPLLLAPEREQQRIVLTLGPVLIKIASSQDRLKEVFAILARFRHSVLMAACSGKLSADWRSRSGAGEPATALLDRLRAERTVRWQERNPRRKYVPPQPVANEELPAIPPTWVWTNFDHCAWEITVGHVGPMKDRYVEQGVPFLRSQNVRPLRFDPSGLVFIDADFHAVLRKSALNGGEILVTRSGANTGDCCVYPQEYGVGNCSDLVVTRPLSGLVPAYGAIYVSSPEGQTRIGLRETGMAQPHFNIGAMRTKAFPLPPHAEQEEIVRRVDELMKSADSVEKQTEAAMQRIAVLRASVLAKAFRGELVQTEAELASQEGRTYETAHELLERMGRNHPRRYLTKTRIRR